MFIYVCMYVCMCVRVYVHVLRNKIRNFDVGNGGEIDAWPRPIVSQLFRIRRTKKETRFLLYTKFLCARLTFQLFLHISSPIQQGVSSREKKSTIVVDRNYAS